jgi:hypothetical protein
MTATFGRTSPPTILSQRRNRRSGLYHGPSALHGVIGYFPLSKQRLNLLFGYFRATLTSEAPSHHVPGLNLMNIPESELRVVLDLVTFRSRSLLTTRWDISD